MKKLRAALTLGALIKGATIWMAFIFHGIRRVIGPTFWKIEKFAEVFIKTNYLRAWSISFVYFGLSGF